jgi:hypothetical protein
MNNSDSLDSLAVDDIPLTPKEAQILKTIYGTTDTESDNIPKFVTKLETNNLEENLVIPPPLPIPSVSTEKFVDESVNTKPPNKLLITFLMVIVFSLLNLPYIDTLIKDNNVKMGAKIFVFFLTVYTILYFNC